jgi:hypothetical protein
LSHHHHHHQREKEMAKKKMGKMVKESRRLAR